MRLSCAGAETEGCFGGNTVQSIALCLPTTSRTSLLTTRGLYTLKIRYKLNNHMGGSLTQKRTYFRGEMSIGTALILDLQPRSVVVV